MFASESSQTRHCKALEWRLPLNHEHTIKYKIVPCYESAINRCRWIRVLSDRMKSWQVRLFKCFPMQRTLFTIDSFRREEKKDIYLLWIFKLKIKIWNLEIQSFCIIVSLELWEIFFWSFDNFVLFTSIYRCNEQLNI